MSGDGLRIDKWLWHARFYKSRTLAAAACSSGRIRINGVPIAKSHRQLKPGDVLTFPHGSHIRIIRVLALGSRRGPAAEARLLYQELSLSGTTESAVEQLSGQADESTSYVAEQGDAPRETSAATPRS
jgi:ribosome-associated heat shock protein Hsp15